MGVFDEIESDIINNVPLSTVMRKAKVLAHLLNNQDFKSWVEHELTGYHGQDMPLPEYRELSSVSTGTFFNGVWQNKNAVIPLEFLPQHTQKKLRTTQMTEGIKELESLLQSTSDEADHQLGYRWPSELTALFNTAAIKELNGFYLLDAKTVVSKAGLEHILDSVRNRLLDFILQLRDQYPEQAKSDFRDASSIPDDQIAKIFNITIIGSRSTIAPTILVNQGDNMPVFDQRNQNVAYQYNAAGDINFQSVADPRGLVSELEKLRREIANAANAKVITEESQTDAECHVTKAIQQAGKPAPIKSVILQHLDQAKAAIATAAQAAGIVTALTQAADLAQKFFK